MKARYYFLNNRLVEAKDAALHPQDRGFRFGDGIFDSIRIRDGLPRFWPLHEARVQEGLETLGITTPDIDLHAAATELLQANEVTDGVLRIAISRGVGSSGYLPTADATHTLLMETMPLPERRESAIKLWLSGIEKPSLNVLPVHLKIAQGMNPMLARMEAIANDCHEALQLNANGELTEASSANLFWIKGDKLYTPALDCGLLKGVTRQVLLSLCDVDEVVADVEALKDADGVFITNATRGIMPVVSLQPLEYEWEIHSSIPALMRAYEEA